MAKPVFVFTKEMGRLLQKFRKSSKLTQIETAQRLGLSESHISHLENGEIANPPIGTILLYLRACRISWTTFFQKLSEIDFKMEHEKIIRQVEIPSNITMPMRQKIDRDTAKYVNKIQYPKTPFRKLDWERIRTKIDKKVKILLFNHELHENSKAPYFTFANELILNYDTGQARAIFERYSKTRSLNWRIISEIRSIVYKTVRVEQRKLEKPKPLAREKLQKMAGGFLRHRVKIEPIEAEVQKKLGELNVPIVHNQAYKDCTREYYSALKKYYHKDPLLLTQRFVEIMKSWKAQGLNEEILEIVKETAIRIFTQQK